MRKTEFQSRIENRMRSVVRAMRNSCLKCRDWLCSDHLDEACELMLNPKEMLKKLEAKYSAVSKQ